LPTSQAKILKLFQSKILESKCLREAFVNSLNNQLYETNAIIRRPKLGQTFETIAREGESAFYNGQLTDTIVSEIQSAGGIITKEDLNSYECVVREPLSYKLKNNIEIYSAPGPSCGFMLNFILALLDSFEHEEYALDVNETNSLFHHRFIEACKYSFGLRGQIGDDSFSDSSNVCF
jgi:gamma-glutamyltranspeptidase/glutathione hydrolase/leukotriene-C4 hydrolase